MPLPGKSYHLPEGRATSFWRKTIPQNRKNGDSASSCQIKPIQWAAQGMTHDGSILELMSSMLVLEMEFCASIGS